MRVPAPEHRPGLHALDDRAVTYATSMHAMTVRLAAALPGPGTGKLADSPPALFDGWAMIADVLTFRGRRIANEGYLRTATEKRSVLELAKLVGYRPRPGVAASVFLAYTLEQGANVHIPAGSKVQSVPGPGEAAQTFETVDTLDARDRWNNLRVRDTRPQSPNGSAPFYLNTVTTGLEPNDLLLFVRSDMSEAGVVVPDHRFVRIAAVEPQLAKHRTRISLHGAGLMWDAAEGGSVSVRAQTPEGPAELLRPAESSLEESSLEVYAFRTHAPLYGANAPAPPVPSTDHVNAPAPDWPLAQRDRDPQYLSLDARCDRIVPGSFIGVRTFPSAQPVLFAITDVRGRSRCDYGLPATTTVLTLNAGYMSEPNAESTLATLRDIDVFAQSERLTLAEMPIASDLPDPHQAGATVLELDGMYDGLAAGRWAVVAGTRTDLPGVRGAELVMIALTEQRTNPAIAGDRPHTFITLSTKLVYRYARAGFTIAGNVVRATHGETCIATIGSGNARQARQSFSIAADPLTFVAAPTQSGAQSTLTVRVNGQRWVETGALDASDPADRAYTTTTSDTAATVTFGDGVHAARLPTGENNVTATYRVGLGAAGNVAAERLSILMSRPAGVEAVGNPLPACGGADAESADDVRRNAPASLRASDRLVSLDDYAHFARTFAGVAKATAGQIGSVREGAVYITLAGPDGAGIDLRGDLPVNLQAALRRLADPRRSLAMGTYDRVLLLIGASIDLAPGAIWETVEPAIRSALGATFAFTARDFGQPAFKSEATAAIARVAGVVDVAVDLFTRVTAATLAHLPALAHDPVVALDVIAPLPARQIGATIAPAQIVLLEPRVRATMLLREAGGGAG